MHDPIDEAMSARLARLRSFPVDTTRMDKALREQLPPAATRKPRRWAGQISAAAACLAVIFTLMFVTLQGRPVQASPNMMAQMHQDIVSGKVPTMKAESIEEANQAIAAMAGGKGETLRLPEAPDTHTMACCMRNIGNKKVACVLLKNGGKPVTMSVASAKDISAPAGPAVEHNGQVYYVQSSGTLHMVSCRKDTLWICLISETGKDGLIAMAERLKP
jgi:hypothetical protein